MTNTSKYNLVLKTRKYSDKTLCSIYYVPKNKKEKKFEPVDVDGYRMRLDKNTGEIDFYPRSICKNNKDYSVRRSRIRLNMLLDMNDFDWFVTLTFDPELVDRADSEAVYETYDRWVNLIKHQYPSFRYITVPEKHKDDNGCYHFHMVIGGISPDELGLVNSGKVCCHWSTKNGICSKEYFNRTFMDHKLEDTDGIPVYNISKFQYGFSTVSRIQSRERLNHYVKKYIDKNFGVTDDYKKRFFYSTNLKMPEERDLLLEETREYVKNIVHLNRVKNLPVYQYSESQHYNENFNNLQFWVDNDYADDLLKDLIPLELVEDVQIQIEGAEDDRYYY